MDFDFGDRAEEWRDKNIDSVIDFVCTLIEFGAVFMIYKIVKRFCRKPELLNVDSIIEIVNSDAAVDDQGDQGNNNDDNSPTQPEEVTPLSNPFLNDQNGASAAIATSENHFLASFRVNEINGVQQNAYEPVLVPQTPLDYPLSAQEKRDRRLSRLSMADFPPPPTLTAQ